MINAVISKHNRVHGQNESPGDRDACRRVFVRIGAGGAIGGYRQNGLIPHRVKQLGLQTATLYDRLITADPNCQLPEFTGPWSTTQSILTTENRAGTHRQ